MVVFVYQITTLGRRTDARQVKRGACISPELVGGVVLFDHEAGNGIGVCLLIGRTY